MLFTGVRVRNTTRDSGSLALFSLLFSSLEKGWVLVVVVVVEDGGEDGDV